ncbi:MAG: glutamyl-tRNA amidotransferase [Candidatus Omnitrophica bacterium CG07_land_8_20_14_0_80_42_15]|uniref:Glutamyl-tRNA amidotransferase n=1 Tax=Candidatus Aquitaenariimonas noxiae TaxID=1974741 RepID=A0A2J0KRL3_9BACT|nr:MAG: glutamyl-tRNA amidotransferase [Candidatus Omnitrophica bacterium CG07_land_8_20_14_0_80_42_15]
MLQEKIEKDLKGALKQRDSVKVGILRLVKADICNYMIEKLLKEIKDEDILGIIQKQIKRHQESIELFKKGSREDLVKKETEELATLNIYMPKMLSEEELKIIVKDTAKELQATDKKDFGKIMKAVIEKTKGRVDGKLVSKLVSELWETK